jgi:hypothetical protein
MVWEPEAPFHSEAVGEGGGYAFCQMVLARGGGLGRTGVALIAEGGGTARQQQQGLYGPIHSGQQCCPLHACHALRATGLRLRKGWATGLPDAAIAQAGRKKSSTRESGAE